jgi:glucosamine-6-phosphate deaminase
MSELTGSDILGIGPEALLRDSGMRVEVVTDDAALSARFAEEMTGHIRHNNRLGRPTSFILPVGPRGGYPIFVDAAGRESLDLSRTTFFFMDEYLDEAGRYIPQENPLSFRGFVRANLVDRLSGHPGFDAARVHFPDPEDPGGYGRLMRDAGGIDLALAGVGIDGHVAFNEPEPGMSLEQFSQTTARVVALTPETRAINAAMEAGGAIERIPRHAVTVGMAEILASRRIVVFMNRGWQKAVVRKFLFGEVTAGFPVSLLRGHADLTAVITAQVAERPLG